MISSQASAWPTDSTHQPRARQRTVLLPEFLSLPVLMWLGLWFGINTGPSVLEQLPTGALAWAHYLRTIFPLVSLAVASVMIVARLALRPESRSRFAGPLRFWFFYGVLGLLFCIRAPRPEFAAYWSLCYLSVFATLKLWVERGGDTQALRRCLHLNYLSWFVTAAFLAVLVVAARDVLLAGGRDGLTGYGVVNRAESVGGMAMSRSSGFSRFAAVPGIVSFVWIWTRSGWERLFWAGVTLACAALIYMMQSRGAIVGFGAALAFVTIFLGGRARWIGALALVIFGLALVGELIPDSKVDEITRHLTRSADREGLVTLTGRTRTWENAWAVLAESPLYGWGPQADRHLVGQHVHNTYLYAWLQSGLLGVALFAIGLLAAWRLFARALRSGIADRVGQRAALLQVGGLLAFFTVRSIPEVCGAMYAVDLMVMLPAMAYLSFLVQAAPSPGEAS